MSILTTLFPKVPKILEWGWELFLENEDEILRKGKRSLATGGEWVYTGIRIHFPQEEHAMHTDIQTHSAGGRVSIQMIVDHM